MLIVFADFWCFPVAKTNLGIFESCRFFSLWVRPFGTFESCGLEEPFLNTAGVVLILWYFFQVLLIFFADIWCFPVSRTYLKILSNVVMFRYGRGLLVHLNFVDWKTYFSILQRLLNILIFFLDFVDFFSQTFDVSWLLEPIWKFFSNVRMFHYGQGLLVHLNLVDWKTHFSILQGLL